MCCLLLPALTSFPQSPVLGVHFSPFSPVATLLYHEHAVRDHEYAIRGSEQPQSVGRRYGVSTRLHGKLDEDAFDVGLHGLRGNLQLLRDAFVG